MKFERTITAAGCAERGWLDLTGTAVSWVCLIHCLALPFLIALLPLAGLSFLLDERIEWVIIGVSVAVGAFRDRSRGSLNTRSSSGAGSVSA